MMTKSALLRWIEEIESKLAGLRSAVTQWPEAVEAVSAEALTDLEQEETRKEGNDLHEVFAILRTGWDIPPDVQSDMPLEELQKAMAEGCPENWASREIMRMREE
jgi:hypothetical protein